MSQTVKIDRDAFRRGVEDVMTLAPLRDAVRAASSAFMGKTERNGANPPKNAPAGQDVQQHGQKSSCR